MKLRIALTADPFLPVPPVNYGGIERIINFLAEGLAEKGHEVILVAHPDSEVNVMLKPYSTGNYSSLRHIKNALTINQLRKWQPDVIHSFSRLAYLAMLLPSGIPKIMSYQREPTLSQINKAMALARNKSLSFTGCSNYITQQIKAIAPACTVYNGVEINKYAFKNTVDNNAPLVFLGRIEPIKGTHHAIKVAQQTGRKLVIAGNIPDVYKNYFDTQIKPHLNTDIEYIGPVNDEQKSTLLSTALALLMPIEWNEPFGIVMAEAMACGTPVIGFNKGAVPEVIRHGINGFICNTPQQMAQLVQQAETIARADVRADAAARFSSEVIIQAYLEVYKKAIDLNCSRKK